MLFPAPDLLCAEPGDYRIAEAFTVFVDSGSVLLARVFDRSLR